MRPRLAVLVMALMVVGCSPTGPVAMVDGTPIEWDELRALHPEGADVDAEEQASSVFLLILHQLVVQAASDEFGVVPTETEIDAAFEDRTDGYADVDAVLTERGVTRTRVRLEAELDVIRRKIEEAMVRSGWPGTDLDEAYRDFLAANSNACLVVLTLADEALVDPIQQRVDDGDDLDDIFATYPDRTARIDMGCRSPIAHGTELAPVALDGEVGRSYARHPQAGGVYVVKVVERTAPPMEEVQEQVLELAITTQGPDLFTAWAADLLRGADVEVNESVGRWTTVAESGDVPIVATG